LRVNIKVPKCGKWLYLVLYKFTAREEDVIIF
jgi:hypothetical protein